MSYVLRVQITELLGDFSDLPTKVLRSFSIHRNYRGWVPLNGTTIAIAGPGRVPDPVIQLVFQRPKRRWTAQPRDRSSHLPPGPETLHQTARARNSTKPAFAWPQQQADPYMSEYVNCFNCLNIYIYIYDKYIYICIFM